MIQRARRANPYPFTWEIPAALVLAVLLALVLGVQLGRSVANLLAGNGWAVVDRAGLFTTLPGILAGHADAGLAGIARPAQAGPLYGSVILAELAVVTGCALGLRWGWQRWGPARLRGMATRAEAEAALGRTRLRRHARVIRPDLYGPGKDGRR